MQAVKAAVSIPVVANGNIRSLADVHACMEYTGADGIMSAESLLANPALFLGEKCPDEEHLRGCRLLLEYLDLCEQHPVPYRMVKGHAFKMLGALQFSGNALWGWS